MKRRKTRKSARSLLPRGKKERRRLELLGGSAFAVIVGVIVIVFFAASAQRFLIGLPQTAAVITSILVELANGDRAGRALSQLRVNPILVAAAQAKANDMAAKGYFAHVSPDGKDPWYWFKEAGYSFVHAGENLAVDFSDSADVERAWMNSPAHRDNILDPRFTEIGIATAVGTYQGRETVFVVQEFGTPAPSAPVSQQLVVEHVPETPTELATAVVPELPPEPVPEGVGEASVPEPEQVLGSAKVAPEAVALPQESATEVSSLPAPINYAIASPRTSLRYTYIAIGVLLLAALAYTTRFEMKKHHLRHVKAVTLLIVFMGALLLAGNYFIFTEPVIASTGPPTTQN